MGATIYFLPSSDLALKNRIFYSRPKYRGGVSNNSFWPRFMSACEASGMQIFTFDYWSKDRLREDDILLVQDHPGEALFWRTFHFLKNFGASRGGFLAQRRRFFLENHRFFRRRILWEGESPAIVPYFYKNLENIIASGIYQKIILNTRHDDCSYFNYFDYRDKDFISPNFDDPKEKFIAMINTNVAPHSLTNNELYGERLKAIRYWSDVPGFDLYGYGWDRRPRHPLYFHYGKYVRKVFRGSVADKIKTLSSYKFTICFANCAYRGYVDEKIFDCLAAGSIPIYLGAPDVEKSVPPSCFIDFRRFADYSALHKFLSGLTEADLVKYRAEIRSFLNDYSAVKSMDQLIAEIVGIG